jgi:hypothetical protein
MTQFGYTAMGEQTRRQLITDLVAAERSGLRFLRDV